MAAPVDAADLTVLEDLHDRILADMGDEDELTAIGFHRNGWIEITVKGRTPQVCAAIHARFGHLVQILPAS